MFTMYCFVLIYIPGRLEEENKKKSAEEIEYDGLTIRIKIDIIVIKIINVKTVCRTNNN